MIAICTRLVQSSFAKIFETCAFTVASLMNRRIPICALDSPAPTAPSTSVSRSVSWSRPGWRSCRAPGFASEKWESIRRVTVGESIASPPATTCTARARSWGGVSLSRNPLAPASSAWKTYSSMSKVVSMMIFGGLGSAVTALVAAIPSRVGMRTSISSTSGRCFCTSGTASEPSAPCPTTSMPGSAPRIIARPARTRESSSISPTRLTSPSATGSPPSLRIVRRRWGPR